MKQTIRERILDLTTLMTDENDATALSATRSISELLERVGLGWEDIITNPITPRMGDVPLDEVTSEHRDVVQTELDEVVVTARWKLYHNRHPMLCELLLAKVFNYNLCRRCIQDIRTRGYITDRQLERLKQEFPELQGYKLR